MRLAQSPAICWKARKEQSSASGRRAFSLIELIVALALSVVLISAIYSAISLHWRYETLGRERIDRAQVSLAILRRMSEDLGSVMFSVPAATETDEEAESTTTDSTTDEETESTSATSSVTPVSLGIVGTANSLQLDVSQLQLQDFVPVVDPSEPVATMPSIPSELVRVTWTLIRPQRSADPSATGLQSLIINPALVRDLVDRLQESVPDETADTSSIAREIPDSSILAREVVELQFRYFDGYSWVSEWDSTEMGRLPRAVEVSLGFLNQEYRPASATNSPGSVSITTVKHVIQVPASTPVTGSEI
jgi:prepilin-type N-terminal cleavage/methylation domain-containing protein